MSIAGITFNTARFTHGVGGEGHERRQAVRALAGALEAGNLDAANDAFQELKALGPGRRFRGTDPVSTDLAAKFAAVGSALETGDVAAAQAAFDTFRSAVQAARGGPTPPPDMSIQPVPVPGEVSIQPVPNPGEASTQPVGLPRVVVEFLARLGFSVTPQGTVGQPGSSTGAAVTVPQIGAGNSGGGASTVPQIGAPASGTTPASTAGGSTPASGIPAGTPTGGAAASGFNLSYSYLQVSWSYGGSTGSYTQTGLSLNVTG